MNHGALPQREVSKLCYLFKCIIITVNTETEREREREKERERKRERERERVLFTLPWLPFSWHREPEISPSATDPPLSPPGSTAPPGRVC